MTALRRFVYPLGLAWARLTRRGERILLVAFGIAVGAALLAGVLAGSLVAQDRSVERATARVPAADRTVRLVWGGIASGPGTDVDRLDGLARYVHVRSGRLPRRCTAQRCEVLELGGSGPVPTIRGLTLAVVGKATLDSPVPFG